MSAREVPLFPLGTVLYPQGPLPLRLFETRYLDMVGRCLRNAEPFAVVGISEGREVGPSRVYEVGTLALISDWYQGSDGLLGITATGQQRFRLLSERSEADGLRVATVELLDMSRRCRCPTGSLHWPTCWTAYWMTLASFMKTCRGDWTMRPGSATATAKYCRSASRKSSGAWKSRTRPRAWSWLQPY